MDYPELAPKINICGTAGSGKSTLAKALSKKIGAPHIEIDAIFHLPDGQEIDRESFRARVADIVSGDRWIIDGDYRKIRDLVHASADTIVWLDYRLPLVFGRMFSRICRMGIRHEELWNGRRETFWKHFLTRESMLLRVLQTHAERRARCQELLASADFGHKVLRFSHPRETAAWLKTLDRDFQHGS